MSRDDSSEDLLVLARQCKLDPEEERRFEIAVQSSRELEALYDAGVQFDEEASLRPGDEARHARLVARALVQLDRKEGAAVPRPASRAARRTRTTRRGPAPAFRPSRPSSQARYLAASVAFGVLLAVALASAWEYAKGRPSPRPAAQDRAEVAPHPAPREPSRVVSSPALPEEPLEVASAPPPAVEAPRPVAPARSTNEAKPRKDDGSTASRLFAHANELRRDGDVEGAISSYERLCEQYPASAEAEDAKLLLGNLLLSQRSPRAALRKFEDYGSGALSLEALWGRAQALRKLGRPDERAVLEELVRDYPTSPYAGAAQRRLQELGP